MADNFLCVDGENIMLNMRTGMFVVFDEEGHESSQTATLGHARQNLDQLLYDGVQTIEIDDTSIMLNTVSGMFEVSDEYAGCQAGSYETLKEAREVLEKIDKAAEEEV